MSDWKQTEFGRIPLSWDYQPLEEYFDLITYGFTNPMPTVDEGPFMLTAKDIFNGRIQYETARRTSREAFETLLTEKSRPKINDVLITKDGSIGRVAIVDRPEICISQSIALIRPNNKIEPLFLKYLLEAPQYQKLIDMDATGSTIQHIYITKINKMLIGVPVISIQKQIVDCIHHIQSKIELLHCQNSTLEKMAETLFRQWFVEEAKEEWEVVKLKNLCTILNGYAFQSETYKESGQVIVRTTNFNNHWVELDKLVFIDNELAKSFEKYQLKRNDFLLVMVGASLGNFAIVTNDILPALQNQNMWAFRAEENFSQHYLNFALRELITENLHSASGSAREFFQKGAFYEFEIIVPPKDKMELFSEHSENWFSKIENNRTQIRTLTAMRDTLLPKLMSGEVRVS